jgi:hypothetical protein
MRLIDILGIIVAVAMGAAVFFALVVITASAARGDE